MNRYTPWTVGLLVSALVILGSIALAQKEPYNPTKLHWFAFPPIFEEDLGPWEDQEVCWYVLRMDEGTPVPMYYRVLPHYPQKMDPKEWKFPPLVIREQKKSVWKKLQESINSTFREGNRWR